MAFLRILISTLLVMAVSSNFTFAQPFRCTSPRGTKCDGLVDYVSPNITTLAAIRNLFQVRNLRSILGANNLPNFTLANTTVSANQTIKIPFPCICNNLTGISNRRPNYTVAPGDGLYHIAAEVFSGLVTFQQIQEVNNIPNPNLILVGQELRIPLPCSCDDVDGQKVVHYGYVVPAGSSVEGIAQQFSTSQDTLLRLNNLTTPQDLLANAVLDVPLRACSSKISNTSQDYPLLVSNGTYVFTANNCVRCSCDAANNWTLHCESSRINSSCNAIRCEGPENLNLGDSSSSGCNRTTCTYTGYTGRNIHTAIDVQSTCANSDNNSSAISFQGLRWNFLLISIHIILICLPFLK